MNPTVHPVTPRDGRDRRWDDHRTERRRSLVEATLRAVRMPARDHFVPDNRKPTAPAK